MFSATCIAILIIFALALLLPLASSSMDVVTAPGVDQYHRQLKKCSFDDTLGIVGIVIMSCENVCGIDGLTFKASTIPAVCEFVTKDSNALNEAKALGCPSVNGNFFCKYGEVSTQVQKGNDDAMCDYCTAPPPTPKPPAPSPPTPEPPTPCRRRELQNPFFENLQDKLDDEDCPPDSPSSGGDVSPSASATANSYCKQELGEAIKCEDMMSQSFQCTMGDYCQRLSELVDCADYQRAYCNILTPYGSKEFACCPGQCQGEKEAVEDCFSDFRANIMMNACPNPSNEECTTLMSRDDVADSFEPTVGPAPTPQSPTPRPPTPRPPTPRPPTPHPPTPQPPTPQPPTPQPPTDSIASTSGTDITPGPPPQEENDTTVPSAIANDPSECSMELRALQLCAMRGCGEGCDIPGEIADCEGWQTAECLLMSSNACCPDECSNEIEDAIVCTTKFFLGSGDMVDCTVVSSEICQDIVKSNGEAIPSDTMEQTASGASGPNGVDMYAWPRIALIMFCFASNALLTW